jgi:hypothetical protein
MSKDLLDAIVDFGPEEVSIEQENPTQKRLYELINKIKELSLRIDSLNKKLE